MFFSYSDVWLGAHCNQIDSSAYYRFRIRSGLDLCRALLLAGAISSRAAAPPLLVIGGAWSPGTSVSGLISGSASGVRRSGQIALQGIGKSTWSSDELLNENQNRVR
jgi:hypothetical protein